MKVLIVILWEAFISNTNIAHAPALHMSPHLGCVSEVPLHFGRTEGIREQRRWEILVRTVSCWRSRFHPSLDFPELTRRSSLPAVGCAGQLRGRHCCHSTERDGDGQHPRPLPRNRDAIPAGSSPPQEVRARRAHVDAAEVAAPTHPVPTALGGPGGRTLVKRFWGKIPRGKANPTSFPPGCLIFLY